MTLLEAITAYLADEASLEVGETIFRGGVPAAGQETVSAAIPTGGVARGESPLVEATFQVLTRGASLADCLEQAEAIYAACLDSRRLPRIDVAVSGRVLQLLEPMQPPTDIGLDPEGRRRTSFNLRVIATE